MDEKKPYYERTIYINISKLYVKIKANVFNEYIPYEIISCIISYIVVPLNFHNFENNDILTERNLTDVYVNFNIF